MLAAWDALETVDVVAVAKEVAAEVIDHSKRVRVILDTKALLLSMIEKKEHSLLDAKMMVRRGLTEVAVVSVATSAAALLEVSSVVKIDLTEVAAVSEATSAAAPPEVSLVGRQACIEAEADSVEDTVEAEAAKVIMKTDLAETQSLPSFQVDKEVEDNATMRNEHELSIIFSCLH